MQQKSQDLLNTNTIIFAESQIWHGIASLMELQTVSWKRMCSEGKSHASKWTLSAESQWYVQHKSQDSPKHKPATHSLLKIIKHGTALVLESSHNRNKRYSSATGKLSTQISKPGVSVEVETLTIPASISSPSVLVYLRLN